MAEKQEEDIEALGLIAHSYDALFSIRKRTRKINDLVIPFRNGLTNSQIGTAILVFFIMIISFGLVVNPLFNLFGAHTPWQLLVLWLFVPPFFAAQNIVKPMPYNKSIPGTVQSILRYALDDKVHRRGMPIPAAKRPKNKAVVHYQREWVAFEEHVADEPGEAPVSDVATEARMSFCDRSAGDKEIDFQGWWDGKAADHLEEEHAAAKVVRDDSDKEIGARRGRATSVLSPDAFGVPGRE